ncbi:hypothetical protein DSO57_1023652 [Entomophthora muscae]|uniref:Uncharacterized protein n=1 Tax=Entomophthora muscae TaxID=34485 RepID=A0ACC2S4N6_9FUNG|nr:hypothetical protein DSO57_1023652 [Entomophthora muscae]
MHCSHPYNQLPPIRGITHLEANVRLPSLKAIMWEVLHPRHTAPFQTDPPKVSLSFKRSRRLFWQINRIYKCRYPGCKKAYGAINHLNTHIVSQKHGPKMTTNDYISF